MKLKIRLRKKNIPHYWQSIKLEDYSFTPNLEHIKLILAAFGIPCKIIFFNGHLFLYLPPLLKNKALFEINAFYSEKSQTDPIYLKKRYPHAWLSLIFMGFFLLWHFFCHYEKFFDRIDFYSSIWSRLGSLDHIQVLLYHQWYRAITSLTLHSDIAHLAANIFFGGLFLYLTSRNIGFGLSVFCGLVSSVLGNFLSIFLHRFPASSIGASTFVFSIIGIFCLVNSNKSSNKNKIFLNLAAALGLLGLLGTQGKQVDYPAHIAGLGFGALSGYFIVVLNLYYLSERIQIFLYFISLAIFILAWIFAFQKIS